jgi:predicted nucleic acid-binding protein
MSSRIKVYLDTSVVSALFDDRNPERQGLTSSFFNILDRFDVHVSDLTLAELERTPDRELARRMRNTVAGMDVLEVTKEVEDLADEYVRQGAVPDTYPADAMHIAVASLTGMDFLLSWNFRHLVRRRTRDVVDMVNTMRGMRHISIATPAELL